MDFSCDVRKKYLLLECIDCFNGRAQGAKRERERRERGDRRHRRVRAESISLIRRASVMHRQKYTHTRKDTRVFGARTCVFVHALIYLTSFVL